MEFFSCSSGGGEGEQPDFNDFFGPQQVDQAVRHAIQACWMALPKERRNAEEVERQIRRLVDRALRDFREDREAFGCEDG